MATLFSGQTLHPEQSLQSNNKQYKLILQSDGNVVLYNQQSQAIWATNTKGLIQPREFIMQTDGNLVLYDTNGSPKWASNTYNNLGAFLNVQNDGNLVVYRAGSQSETANNALWASGSNSRPPSEGLSDKIEAILAEHNKYRAEVGVPPLQWSENLAASAQQWANHLAVTGTFNQHSGAGENLANSTAGAYSVTQLIDLWGNEKQYFKNGIFPDVSTTTDWKNIGHYTQVIWRNTREVGCGLASGHGNDVLVCQYNPAGNFIGQSVL